ncbi:MAG: 4'-phosphopantetheinyl transferase superfamily protein [Gammaproteobacteria bacterium]|nr:4'-phosphopantetheinyl transferase superfamily protein [Gammaproteobacteria bacterium]
MSITWQPLDSSPALKASEVHLIAASLSEDPAVANHYWEILSSEEQARANQFRFAKHRSHFIMARGILRHILAGQTGIQPKAIEFRYLEYGKPELLQNTSPALQFNVSHSDAMALYALTLEHSIGVDIEMIKPCNELELAKRFFAQDEYKALHALSAKDRTNAFFQIWTLKEAFIKALGTGLFQALDQFCVSAGAEGKLISCQDANGPTSDWYMRVFNYSEHYQAAFASKQAIKAVHYWQWQNILCENR